MKKYGKNGLLCLSLVWGLKKEEGLLLMKSERGGMREVWKDESYKLLREVNMNYVYFKKDYWIWLKVFKIWSLVIKLNDYV